jgi:hypothetical protein
MITLPEEVLELLDEGRNKVVGLMVFAFGTGTYRFARSADEFEWNGDTYLPGGAIQVSDLSSSIGMAAEAFTITLAASPDDGLTPAVLKTIEAEDYRDRPVTIYDAILHPDTNEILFVDAVMRGYVDTIDHEEDPEQGYRLIATCESRQLDFTRTNGRRRSHADQQRRAPGDKFLKPAASRRTEEVFWGKLKTGVGLPAPSQQVASPSGAIALLNKVLGPYGVRF